MLNGSDEQNVGKSMAFVARVRARIARRDRGWLEGGNEGNQSTEARVTSGAREVLASHPRFYGYVDAIQIEFNRDTLTLSGELPSFYTKQLIQETLRSLDFVGRIENRIRVAYPGSCSSGSDE